MEALLEEKEKEIVKNREWLQVRSLGVLKGNKSCCSIADYGKVIFTLLNVGFFLWLLFFPQRIRRIQLHN